MRVLHTVHPATQQGNPFVDLMIASLPDEIESEYFSWRRALTVRYDVVHFQWPEKFVVGGSWPRRAIKRASFILLLGTLRLRRSALVLTVHNLEAHEAVDGWGNRLLHRLEAVVQVFVLLNPAHRVAPPEAREILIPHGHYREVTDRYPAKSHKPANRLIYFGFIREYKMVPELIAAYRHSNLADSGTTLAVLGRPHNAELRERVNEEARGCDPDTISTQLRAIPEAELYAEIRGSEAVVLPYAQLYNSGAAILALSLNRPVIVPRTPSTERLQNEFGSAWVALYDAPLDARKLETAVGQLRHSERGNGGPNLDRLDWRVLGEAYAEAYKEALSLR